MEIGAIGLRSGLLLDNQVRLALARNFDPRAPLAVTPVEDENPGAIAEAQDIQWKVGSSTLSLRTLIEGIVTSPQFLNRRGHADLAQH